MKKTGVGYSCGCTVSNENKVTLCINHSIESEHLQLTPNEMVDKFVSDFLNSCKIDNVFASNFGYDRI